MSIKAGFKNLALTVPAILSKVVTKSEMAGHFLNSYGWDFAFPWIAYHLIKSHLNFVSEDEFELSTKEKLSLGGISMLIPATGEIAQYFHAYPGTYDPRDFIAAGLGAITVTAFDMLMDKRKLERRVAT